MNYWIYYKFFCFYQLSKTYYSDKGRQGSWQKILAQSWQFYHIMKIKDYVLKRDFDFKLWKEQKNYI